MGYDDIDQGDDGEDEDEEDGVSNGDEQRCIHGVEATACGRRCSCMHRCSEHDLYARCAVQGCPCTGFTEMTPP